MELSFTDKKKIRKSFGKLENIVNIPDLIEVQKKSYDNFLQFNRNRKSGLDKVFKEVYPIEDFAGLATIEYVDYRFENPKYDVEECKQRGLNLLCTIKSNLRLSMPMTLMRKRRLNKYFQRKNKRYIWVIYL